MTIHDGISAEWTVSRIMRLLRPLKNKCSALSSYIKEHPADFPFGGQHLGEDQGLLPLENPSKIGVRIHFNRDTVQSFELSKRVYAVRDCFHDLLSKENSAIGSMLSLVDLCSVILGAQIPREESLFATSDTPDTVEMLYEEIPPIYRFRTLTMHALHIILETCPQNGSLYLALLNVTLDHRLYHESEALLDAILDYAFETSSRSSNSLRISNHRRFLVDLYSSWTTRFPSSTFVRLTTSALRRASSDNVWTSKAIRRLVRKFVRYDHAALSIIITTSLSEVISTHRSGSKPTDGLDQQLRDWLYFCVEICTPSASLVHEGLLLIQNQELLDTVIDCHRSCLYQTEAEGCDGNLSMSAHGNAVVCLYSLWLAGGSRPSSSDDYLHIQVQQYRPSLSTFAPLCSHLLRTKSLSECRDILAVLSSIFESHNLPWLIASLLACIFSHIEKGEIEQLHIDGTGMGSVRDFKSWLADYVDKVKKESVTSHHNGLSTDEASEIDDQNLDSVSDWCWEPSVECWSQRNARVQSGFPATPKRRKISHPPSHKPVLSKSFRCSVTSASENSAGEDNFLCFLTRSPGESDESFGNTANTCEKPVPFISLLSNALSSRTSLRIEHQKAIQDDLADDRNASVEEMDWNSDDSDTDSHDADIDHAESEDLLDLFKISGASPF